MVYPQELKIVESPALIARSLFFSCFIELREIERDLSVAASSREGLL